jgi:hypothetical protein
MKVRYTFNAELEDVHEILFQKYSRAYGKNDLAELHQNLKVSCLDKKGFKEIEKVLTIYKDAIASVYLELEEDLGFISGLIKAMEGGQQPTQQVEEQTVEEEQEVSKSTDDLLTKTQATTRSIQQLTGMLSALGQAGKNNE